MIKGVTKSGFSYELQENVMDNMELVDLLADDTTDITFRISKIIKLIFTPEQRKRLYAMHRTEDGRVPVKKIYEEISEIFSSFGAGKNS